jgi:hypothetical protein
MNDLVRGRLSRFSLDAMVNIAAAMGLRVELKAAAFAKAALEQFPEIENNKSVERWCTAWRREEEAKRGK